MRSSPCRSRASLAVLPLLVLPIIPAGASSQEVSLEFPIVFVSRQLRSRPSPLTRATAVERGGAGQLLVRMPDRSLVTLVDGRRNQATDDLPIDVMEPDVSYDGTKVVFSGFVRGENGFRIFEIGADGTGLRQLTRSDRSVDLDRHGPAAPVLEGYDDVDPCYLPDGRVCFVSTRYPETAPDGRLRATNLYVVNADGTSLHRITTERFGADTPAVDPASGRIVYSRWWRSAQPMDSRTGQIAPPVPPGGYYSQGPPVPPPLPPSGPDPETLPDILADIQATAQRGLADEEFTGVNSWFLAGINPDGTGLAMHTGLHLDRQSTQAYRPSFFPDGRMLALFIPESPFLGLPGRNGLRAFQSGAARPVDLGGVQTFRPRPGETVDFFFASPTALPDGRMLVSIRSARAGVQDFDLFVKDSFGALPLPVFVRSITAEVDAVPLLPRQLPPVIPDRSPARLSDRIPRTAGEAYEDGGSFTFLAENLHFNAPPDFLIPNAPPIAKGTVIEFYTSPQRTGIGQAADPPILLHREEIGPGGRVEVKLPAGVPLFEVLRRPDGRLLAGRDGQVFHVGGFNFGHAGQTARCVGCHAGHSMIPMPQDPAWANLAPSATVTSPSTYRTRFRGELEAFKPESLLDRSTRRRLAEWDPPSGAPAVPEFRFTFPVPIQAREVVLHGEQTGGLDERGERLVWTYQVRTSLRGVVQERIFTSQLLSREEGLHVSLDPARDFDELLITLAGMIFRDGGRFEGYKGKVLPGLSEVEVISRVSSADHPSLSAFLRGDSNCDGKVDLSDAISALFSLFEGRGAMCCLASSDANGDAAIDLSDAVSLLGYLVRAGAPPPSPFPACGQGADGELGCDQEGCR